MSTRSVLVAGTVVLAALGCNGMNPESGRHVLPASVTAHPAPVAGKALPPAMSGVPSASLTGAKTPATTPGTTPATTTPAAPTTGIDPSRDAVIRPIVDSYVASGDLPTALAALGQNNVTPAELLKMLRGQRPFSAPFVGGQQALTITDGYGTQTDLQVEAPPASEIQARASKGLGLVVLLHGLGGNGGQTVGLGTQLAATNDVIACGPSAQTLPAGFQPEDGCPSYIASQFPKWWIYEDNHTFALQAVRKVCSMYPIDPERVVLAGASMGGYGTWNIGLRHADRFAAIAPMCGGLTRLGQVGMHDSRSTALLVNGLMFPVWAAHGDADPIVPYAPDKEAADSLTQLGGDVTFHTLAGVGHDISSAILGTGNLAQELTTFVTTKRRKSSPKSLTYLSAGNTLDGAHWLRIVTRSSGVDRATIIGAIDAANNAVKVTGVDVQQARVYLDDRILDLTKPVTVSGASGVKFQGAVTPSLQAILESWRSREDAGLVYSAYVEVDPR